jgi:hypothetical protein
VQVLCLVMHDKLLTADNMLKRNWDCNQFCSVCYCFQESVAHLLLTECNFAEAVWNHVASNFGLPLYGNMISAGGPNKWVSKFLSSGSN